MMRRMTRMIAIGMLVALGALASGSAGAASASAKTGRRPAAHTKRSSAGAKHATTKHPTATQATAKADSTARLAGGPRRLEDIHIEGEIPAPQVLFVTARDQRRFTRFHHQRYLKTSVQVGETTQLPTRIALTSHPPATAGAP